MPRRNILSILEAGDRRMIGGSTHAAAIVCNHPELFSDLIKGLWAEDPRVRMRAADAPEKVTRERPEFLQPHKKELLVLLKEVNQQEVRWHLAVMVPRLFLSAVERKMAVSALSRYLEDRSSIVKTFALQGLADLVLGDGSIRSEVVEILREAVRKGTPAMKARARKLLLRIEGA